MSDRWFCIATNYGQDRTACHSIQADGWPVYMPLHSSRVRVRLGQIEPLFPGYVFARLPTDDMQWPRIYHARGVYRVLGRPGYPQPIPAGVIEALQARTSDRGVVDDPGSETMPYRPGDAIRLTAGPLTGLEGVCQLSRGNRISLLLSLFGRPQQVTVSVQQVAPVA